MILTTFCSALRKNVLFILLIVGFYPVAAQALLTSSALTVTDSFTNFSGQIPLPANWTFQGTGTRGTTWNGNAQASSNSGGWYGDNNISFLGSGTATNADATWALQNTSGSPITQFTLSFKAQLFKSGSASPNVKVYYATASASANPAQGALSSALSSLTFNDATTNITSGTTLTQTVTNLSIASGQYIFIRLIHDGGTNSDNLGWDSITFSAVTNAPTCAKPLNVSTSAVTNTSATINWQAPSGVNNYEYALSTSATPPASGTHLAATTYSAAALSANTAYYFHVRSNCGTGNYSVWESKFFATSGGSSQVKLMSYNLLNYPGSTAAAREPDYRVVMDAYVPDILVTQEISQAIGASSFLTNVLNYTSSTYSLGTFIDGPDSDNALYYKTNAFQFISNKAISTSLRDINQFSLKHNASGDTLIIFSVHLKASTGSVNETARGAEIDSLRKITDAFAPGRNFMVCGDFNFYSPEIAYQKLLAAGNNANGKFNDVITMNGTWNSAANAMYHTQSPRGASFGGMDDRFDLILFSNGI
ncbi:MAG: endonuclease/exonuclease/phosphatase family protein, partial [Bacteroidota bacterium]